MINELFEGYISKINLFSPGDKFSVMRYLGASVQFKETYRVIRVEKNTATVEGQLINRVAADGEELLLGRCEEGQAQYRFIYNDRIDANIETDIAHRLDMATTPL